MHASEAKVEKVIRMAEAMHLCLISLSVCSGLCSKINSCGNADQRHDITLDPTEWNIRCGGNPQIYDTFGLDPDWTPSWKCSRSQRQRKEKDWIDLHSSDELGLDQVSWDLSQFKVPAGDLLLLTRAQLGADDLRPGRGQGHDRDEAQHHQQVPWHGCVTQRL